MKHIIGLLILLNGINSLAQDKDKLVAGMQDICWSPDGRSIYFSGMWHKSNYSDYKPEKWSIYKFDFDTKSMIKFADSALTVSVSSSGEKIVIGKIRKGNRDIYIVDNAGKNPKRITSHPKEDNWISLSPKGKQIVFNSNRDGKHEIYIINTDSSGLRRLTNSNGAAAFSPQWSPDGKKIVYYLEKGDSRDQIYVMDANRSNQKNITSDTLLNYYPSWITNNKILYTQDLKNGNQKIITCKPDGSEKKQLLNIKSFYAKASPNGDRIAFIDNKEHCIGVITSEGEPLEKIKLPEN